MKKLLYVSACFLLFLGVWACERPKSPDFQLNHELEAPLSVEKTYPFLGGDEALIDTTSEDYEDYFSSDTDGMVHITNEEEFNFGNMDDAIPKIDADPATIEVSGAAGSQTMSAEGELQIDQNSFEFRDETNHFVELGAGSLIIDVSSTLDVTVDISFQDVEDESGEELVISDIEVSENESYSESFDLTGHRIKAYQGELDFTIEANTKGGSVTNSDKLDVKLDLQNLITSKAVGYIVPDIVMLNADQTVDGEENLDIFNNDEAKTINIDGIDDISDRISGLIFENPILGKFYSTNLGVNTTIYAVISGTDNTGNTEFLTGKDPVHKVQEGEIPSELLINGQSPKTDEVIKFTLDKAENPDPEHGEQGSNEFDASNSNTSTFFKNLPDNIRFIGVAKINNDEQNNDEEEGTIVNPVIFDPMIGFDLPLNFSADRATFKDTLDADLGDLPGEEDDQSISEAVLTLNYANALPLDLDLVITLLDENGEEVTHKGNLTVDGAGVNDNGYVDEPSENNIAISFSEEELKTLNRTRSMQLDVEINTPQQTAVRVRKDDSVTLQIQMKADITSTVN